MTFSRIQFAQEHPRYNRVCSDSEDIHVPPYSIISMDTQFVRVGNDRTRPGAVRVDNDRIRSDTLSVYTSHAIS